jgi:hypothetical protein
MSVPGSVYPSFDPMGTATPKRSRRRLFVIVTAVLVVCLVGGAILVLNGGGLFSTEVEAEPIQTAGANPFMPPVGTDQAGVTAPAQMTATTGQLPAVPGNVQGLYGGTLNTSSCDPEAMISFLAQHPDKAAAWAGVEGIPAAGLAAYIRSLTPVILRTDTAVTNHGFADGQATTVHSVLQAGTAALVDSMGVPRSRCFCGNPLTPAVRYSDEHFSGPRWPTFAPTQIVTIQPSPVVIKVFVLVNPVTKTTVIERPVGTSGIKDSPGPPIQQPSTGSTAMTSAAPAPNDPATADIAGTYSLNKTILVCNFGHCDPSPLTVRIDCTGEQCSVTTTDGSWVDQHPLTHDGATWQTSGPEPGQVSCNGGNHPGAAISLELTVDSTTTVGGVSKADKLSGTFAVSAPATVSSQGQCDAGNSRFALAGART